MLNKTTIQSDSKLPSLNRMIVSKMDTISIENINSCNKGHSFEERDASTDTWTLPPTFLVNIQ